MKHIERAQLAFRALFFMEMWEEFLAKANYPKGKHFLSHKACDITQFLVRGLLQLIVVYRNLDGVYLLLPWLLTTEVCEHVFGLCRQIVKDFTELDWHYMIPKLFLRLREHALFSKFSNGKERASGYNHTHMDNQGVDLGILSTYPSDDDLSDAAITAYAEAESLWTLLGAPPSASTDGPTTLPSIKSWFTESENVANANGNEDDEDEDEDDCVGDWEEDIDDVSEFTVIQMALDELETFSVKTFHEEDEVNQLAFAAIALSVAEGSAM